MYLRPAFEQTDPAAIRALVAANPFAQLVTHGPRGMEASHLPLLVLDAADGFLLAGHFAAGNPQSSAIGAGPDALAIFSGPHAYIAPAWYAAHPAVPTWDFAAVHVYGRLEPLHDPALVAADIQGMAANDPAGFEIMDLTPTYRARMFAGIRAFRLHPTRVEAQWKMSQNRSPTDRRRVMAALRQTGGAMDADVAAMIGQTLPEPA